MHPWHALMGDLLAAGESLDPRVDREALLRKLSVCTRAESAGLLQAIGRFWDFVLDTRDPEGALSAAGFPLE